MGSMTSETPTRPYAAAAGGIHSWADLPADLLRLVFLDLHTQAAGGHALQEAARLWLAVAGVCRSWRAVALAEVGLHVRLEHDDWIEGALPLARRVAALPLAELSLPAQPQSLGYDSPGLLTGFDLNRAVSLLYLYQTRLEAARPPARMQLCALHGLLPQVAATGVLAYWTTLERLSLAGGLHCGGGETMPPFQPGVFPPSLRQLDMPAPYHPFRVAGGLPPTLTSLTLRCYQDFLLTRDALGSSAGVRGEGDRGGPLAHKGALPPSWRQLAVHAERTAGLNLDDLRLLPWLPHAGSGAVASHGAAAHGSVTCASEPRGSRPPCSAAAPEALPPQRSLMLVAPQVMLSTADPDTPTQLAAPPVRSLQATLAQHLAVLAPVLAAAGLARLCIVAGEASFYCRRPGRLGIIDAGALPPAGRVEAAPSSALGYTATLAWPAGAGTQQAPSFELCFSHKL